MGEVCYKKTGLWHGRAMGGSILYKRHLWHGSLMWEACFIYTSLMASKDNGEDYIYISWKDNGVSMLYKPGIAWA